MFTKSELYTMVFQNTIDTYGVPREATREFVRLNNSIAQDNLKANNVPLGKYFHL